MNKLKNKWTLISIKMNYWRFLYLFLLKVIKVEMSAIFFGEYKNIKKLGEGSFAKVYLVEDQ